MRASRRLAARAADSRGFARFVGLLERLDRRPNHLFSVLTYHRIDEPGSSPLLDPALMSATPEEFERHMSYLAAHRPVLSLDDVLAIRRGETAAPPGAVMVTFDDGYRDFGEVAWPVSQRLGIPLTLFLPTAYPDAPDLAFWWDRLHAGLATAEARDCLETPAGLLPLATAEDRLACGRQLRDWVWATPHDEAMAGIDRVLCRLEAPPLVGSVLSWEELRALCSQGLSVGGQTQTHPMVNRLPLEDAQREIIGSLGDMERELGTAPAVFAFPAGGHSDELVSWLSDAGFELGFTTERGSNDLRDVDWLRLRRFNVGMRCTEPLLRAQMLRWVASPRGVGRRLVQAA